ADTQDRASGPAPSRGGGAQGARHERPSTGGAGPRLKACEPPERSGGNRMRATEHRRSETAPERPASPPERSGGNQTRMPARNFGTRRVIFMPSPGAVSTTRPKSSPNVERIRSSTL